MQTRIRVLGGAVLAIALSGWLAPASAQTNDSQALRQEIEQLRKELAELQRQYGERLSALEARLTSTATPAPAEPQPQLANLAAAGEAIREFGAA